MKQSRRTHTCLLLHSGSAVNRALGCDTRKRQVALTVTQSESSPAPLADVGRDNGTEEKGICASRQLSASRLCAVLPQSHLLPIRLFHTVRSPDWSDQLLTKDNVD
ncbi:hypothetical protein BaRGS_00017258 [Batillaria attramentaria]|uniref:Secreted protein n=1 Tax=Batillaria attramentaria TaxID=370345 RepID=A0ABD0KW27_9CAEN